MFFGMNSQWLAGPEDRGDFGLSFFDQKTGQRHQHAETLPRPTLKRI
jgi:hypothetical protein